MDLKSKKAVLSPSKLMTQKKTLAYLIVSLIAGTMFGVYVGAQYTVGSAKNTPVSVSESIHVAHNPVLVTVHRVNGQVEYYKGYNVITNNGLNATRDFWMLGGNATSTTPLGNFTTISLSQDGTSPLAADTTCVGTIYNNSAGLGNVSTNNKNVQPSGGVGPGIGNYSLWYQWTATATMSNVQKGCLWNSTSTSTAVMAAESTFTSVNLNSGDTINVTWFIDVS